MALELYDESNNLFIDFRTEPANRISSSFNIGLGYYVANTAQLSDHNVIIGYGAAGNLNNARDNTVIGRAVAQNMVDATENICIGTGAGLGMSNANFNVFVGRDAGRNATGSQNLFLGPFSGANSNLSMNNVFVGHQAGYDNKESSDNVFIGLRAGYSNRGQNNVFSGAYSGYSTTTGSRNVCMGHSSGRQNISGSDNVAFGADAGKENLASDNTFLGHAAGQNHTTGAFNTVVGSNAGAENTQGYENVFLGGYAGANSGVAHRTTSVGYGTGRYNPGNMNVLIGAEAASVHSTQNTVAIGYRAGRSAQGTLNTVLGSNAATNLKGDQNTVLGGSNVQVSVGSIYAGSSILANNVADSVLIMDSGTTNNLQNVIIIAPSITDPINNLSNTVIIGKMPSGAVVQNDRVYISSPSKVLLEGAGNNISLNTNVSVKGSLVVDGNVKILGFDIPLTLPWANVTGVPTVLTSAATNAFISNVVTTNSQGYLSVQLGGTGRTGFAPNQLLLGSSTNGIDQNANLSFTNSVFNLTGNAIIISPTNASRVELTDGTVRADHGLWSRTTGQQIIDGAGNWVGATLPIAKGGTGVTSLSLNQILLGNNTGSIRSFSALQFNPVSNELAVQGTMTVTGAVTAGSVRVGAQEVITQTRDWAGSVIDVSKGGTGLSSVSTGRLLYGSGGTVLNSSERLRFDAASDRLIVSGNVQADKGFWVGTGRVINDSLQWEGAVVGVSKGGTGKSQLGSRTILIGDTNSVLETTDLTFGSDNTLTARGAIDGTSIRIDGMETISAQRGWTGANLGVPVGGTGSTTFGKNQVLIGNNQNSLASSGDLTFDPVSKVLNVNGTITASTIQSTGGSLTLSTEDVTVNSLSVTNQGTVIDAQGNWTGKTIGVSSGGTGRSAPFGTRVLLIGNQAIVEDSPNLSFDLTNKLSVNGNIECTGGILCNGIQLSGESLFTTNRVPIVDAQGNWKGVTIPVSKGGTGSISLPASRILLGNGTDPIAATDDLLYNQSSRALEVGNINLLDKMTVIKDQNFNANVSVKSLQILGTTAIDSAAGWVGAAIPVIKGGTGRTAFDNSGRVLLSRSHVISDDAALVFASGNLAVSGNVIASLGVSARNVQIEGIDVINQSRKWIGDTVDVPKGGTGSVEFLRHAVILGNGSDPLQYSGDLKFDPGAGRMTLTGCLDVTGNVIASGQVSCEILRATDIEARTISVAGSSIISESGLWQGDSIAVAKGGTGATSFVPDYLLIGSSTGIVQSDKLKFVDNQILYTPSVNVVTNESTYVQLMNGTVHATHGFQSGGTGVINASGAWTGSTVSVAKGGTGTVAFEQDGILVGNGASSIVSNQHLLFKRADGVPNRYVLTVANSDIVAASTDTTGPRLLFSSSIDTRSAPTLTASTGGSGSRVVLEPGVVNTKMAAAIGVQSDGVWYTAPSGYEHKLYVHTDPVLSVSGTQVRALQGLHVRPLAAADSIVTLDSVNGYVAANSIRVNNNFSSPIEVISANGSWGGNLISVSKGGTGLQSVSVGRLLIGDNQNPLKTSADLTFQNGNLSVVGNLYVDKYLSASLGGFSNLAVGGSVVVNNNREWQGSVIVTAKGGTGLPELFQGSVLVGDGPNNAVHCPLKLIWSKTYQALGVGKTPTSGDFKIDVLGKVRSTEGFILDSDARLKHTIERIDGALDKIERISGCTYFRHGSETKEAGVIAQEIESALPEAVYTDPVTGIKSVNTMSIMALLIEAIKELKKHASYEPRYPSL